MALLLPFLSPLWLVLLVPCSVPLDKIPIIKYFYLLFFFLLLILTPFLSFSVHVPAAEQIDNLLLDDKFTWSLSLFDWAGIGQSVVWLIYSKARRNTILSVVFDQTETISFLDTKLKAKKLEDDATVSISGLLCSSTS